MTVTELAMRGELLCQNWDAFRYFLAVARCGSVSRAARHLNESQPTVSRRVRDLEAALSTQLLERHRGGIALTGSGQAVLDHVIRMDREARAMRDSISGRDQRPEGKVVVSVPEAFGHTVFLPQLDGFRTRYPDIEVEALICTRKVNLVDREADLALRLGDPVHGSLVGKKVGLARMSLFAHKRYLAHRSTPRSAADLAEHDIVDGANDLGATIQSKRLQIVASEARRVLRTDSIMAQLSAVRLGTGIGALPRYAAATDPGLVEIIPDEFFVEEDIWVLMNKELKNISRFRVFADFLSSIARNALAHEERLPQAA